MTTTDAPAHIPITIHTDGSCLGNPGPGGWAFCLNDGANKILIAGAEPNTTNNRMELNAAIEALAALQGNGLLVHLVTDSTYVRDGITDWINKWRANGWKTGSKKPVKNIDLWQRLDTLASKHEIEWRWSPAHSGFAENEWVDQAARGAAQKIANELIKYEWSQST